MKAIRNGLIITDKAIMEGKTILFDEKIRAIVPNEKFDANDCEWINAGGNFISGGFIDLHIHGCSGYDTMDELHEGLRRLICRSVRVTDYVSGVENDKIGLLLSETSKDGAGVLQKRLKGIIDGFLAPYNEKDDFWNISYFIVSFPDEAHNRNEFIETIREFISDIPEN